jgi:hypothetical protein
LILLGSKIHPGTLRVQGRKAPDHEGVLQLDLQVLDVLLVDLLRLLLVDGEGLVNHCLLLLVFPMLNFEDDEAEEVEEKDDGQQSEEEERNVAGR